ncbi:FecR domain-containing protein [Uliginosibacterium sp. H1]|uniref:FecR domain-containing protein n=1 Tax=Uliginosibacterium sp. H1 TaxID=3114757 RepID=UPI002E175BAC|nr:FecR domain-containing protein [Uliginosibacterium sp. H1]
MSHPNAQAAMPALTPPLAGGLPIPEAVADAAAEWLTALMADDASAADHERFEQWRSAHPDHQRAWRHIEAVRGRLKVMQPAAAYQALSPFARQGGADATGANLSRRSTLRALFWIGAGSAAGLMASRTQTWQVVTADHRTATGERRHLTLDDGTEITLNTASAIEVHFDAEQRQLRLVAGEIMVVTAHAAGRPGASADPRPFIVETAQGRVRALGTRFTVRQQGEQTRVTVLQSAVEIAPRTGGQTRVLPAGEQATFSRHGIHAPTPVAEQADAWVRGQIVADEMRLDEFIAELGRYRPGLLRCSPEVAQLRVSGVFPLADTDRILATLTAALPVQVMQRTRYWVTVEAASSES